MHLCVVLFRNPIKQQICKCDLTDSVINHVNYTIHVLSENANEPKIRMNLVKYFSGVVFSALHLYTEPLFCKYDND